MSARRLAATVLLLFCLAYSAIAQSGLGSQARDQIRILQEEKRSRSFVEKKLDSQLVYALHEKRRGRASSNVISLKPALLLEPDGRILIDIQAEVTAGLLRFIQDQGGAVVNSFPRYHTIRALVPLPTVDAVAAQPAVRSIRPADRAAVSAVVASAGDISHRADQARSTFLVDGTGVKVGVLSDSVDYLANVQASGGLSKVTVLPDQNGFGSGEGTAMLEIVHTLAPGSDLYFATAFNGAASFAQNIRDLQAAGCRIIVDDVIYFNESPFQDGPIAQAVNDVCAAGTLFFSAAGNSGALDRNSSSTWEGDFKDGGPAAIGRGGRLHDFGGLTYNTALAGGGSYRRVDLFWADPLGASTNDYDVYIIDSTGSVVRSSTNVQDGNSDPYEAIPVLNPGDRIVIVKYSGDARYLFLSAGRGILSLSTAGSVRGHNASGAANAFSVTATRVSSPAQPFLGGTNNPVEWFGSDGPRRMFFYPDGTAITPGNFSSTGGTNVQKPDITAADGGNTSVPDSSPFLGTSAAAPHAAAIAALLWSYSPFLEPLVLRSVLTGTALDIDAPGFDRNSGYGLVMAYPALAAAPALSLKSVQLLDANGNGNLDPAECANLVVTLQNSAPPSGNSITGITAVLTTSASNLLVDPAPRLFADLVPGATSTSSIPFLISTTPLFNYGSNLQFTIHLTTSDALPFNLPFHISSPIPLGSPSDFSNSAALPIPDVGEADSSVVVSGFNYAIGVAQVSVYITHPFDSDLRFSLVAPDGTEVLLSNQNGDGGTNYGAGCDNMTVFLDNATTSIDSGAAPFLGPFQPEQPLSVLAGKSGAGVNGLWTLRVEDLVSGDIGTLQCWSLRLTPFTPFDGGGQCLVGPSIVQSPTDQQAKQGDSVQFAASAQGTAPLSYQWYFNQTDLLPAGTNASLSLADVTPAQSGSYALVVANPYGQATSAIAQLQVLVPPSITCGTNRIVPLGTPWDFDPPTFTGSNALLSILSTTTNAGCGGSYSVTRAWMVSDDTGYSNTCSQTVVVSDTIAIIPTCPADKSVPFGAAWAFDNPVFTEAGDAEVLVYDNWTNNLSIAFRPGSIEVGNQITLDGSARYPTRFAFEYWGTNSAQAGFAGAVQAQVRFYQNDGPMLDSGTAAPSTLIYDSGLQPVKVASRGAVLLQNFQLGAAMPLTGPLPSSFTWTVQFSGFASNDSAGLQLYGPPVVGQARRDYWQHTTSGWVLQTNAFFSVDFGAQLAAASLGLNVAVFGTQTNSTCGNGYAVTRTWQAIDACSNATSCSQTVSIVDQGPPSVLSQPQDLVRVAGASATLAVAVSSCSPLSYQWYFDVTNSLLQQTNATLVLSNLTLDQAGSYRVVVTNASGSITSAPALLDIGFAPLISNNPTNQAAGEGDTISFTVTAQGTDPLSYQWYFNETNSLASATNATLVLSPVTVTNAGDYTVIVSNAYGTMTSAVAQLSVAAPTIVCGPKTNVELGTAWDFAPPVVTGGSNVVLNLLGTTTNAGCGGTFSATRTWLISDATGYSNTCSQIVTVVDTTPPQSNCPTNKTVNYGSVWSFDNPTANDIGAVESVVYDNWTNNLAETLPLGTNELGNEITLAEPGLYLSRLAFEYWGTNALQGDFEGTVQVQVRFYQNDGPATHSAPGSPGTLFYDSGPLPVSATPKGAVVLTDFQLSALAPLVGRLPSSFTWSVQFSGLSSNDSAGLNLYGPPDVGQARPEYWERQSGEWALLTNTVGSANFGGHLEAVNSGVNFTVLNTQTNPICGNGFVAMRTWQVMDECSNAAVCSQTISVVDQGPPTLLAQPQDQVGPVGATASFGVSVSSCPPLGYQWYFNATNSLAGQTDANLVLTNLTLAQAGSYLVIVTNSYGSVTSTPALLEVGVAPVITSDPTNQLASVGDTVSFIVAAQGAEPLNYQWYFNATNSLAAGTNATLVLGPVAVTDAGDYTVVLTNAYGSVTSAVAQLSVAVPTITCGSNRTVELGTAWDFDTPAITGNNAQLTVVGTVTNAACGQTFSATRTWMVSDNTSYQATCSQTVTLVDTTAPLLSCSANKTIVFGSDWVFDTPSATDLNGVTVAVLSTVTNATCGNGFTATRTWQALDACSNAALCSQTVSVVDQGPPTILAQPQDQVGPVGAAASFGVSVSSCPPLGYQWYFNATNMLADQTDTLMLTNLTLAQAGSYLVIVTNSYGSVTSAPALLGVGYAPIISSGPTNQSASLGDTVAFIVVAQGTEPLSYQWYFNTTNWLAAGTNATLVLSPVAVTDAGDYSVVVTNAYGSVTSAVAQLSVAVPTIICGSNRTVELGTAWDFDTPAITGNNAQLTVAGTVTNVACGQTFSATRTWMVSDNTGYQSTCSQTVMVVDTTPPLLSCSANKTIVYGSNWGFDTPTATDLNGVDLTVLSTVTNATCGNGFTATRTWQATDGCSNTALCSQTISVEDQGPPTILAQPQDQVGSVGATASFGASVSSCPPLGYQWYFNATNLLAGETDASLLLTNLTLNQAGSYLVIVTNSYGSVTSAPALLEVGVAPVIASDPTNQLASVGDTVSFIVAAQGAEPLNYQWYFNVTNSLAAGTNATLVLGPVAVTDAGDYTVVVTNAYGSVTSAVAQLTVAVPTITCGINRTVELGTAWDFDTPAITGNNAQLTVAGTVTNAACGQTFSATRTWMVSDNTSYQATCSQTVTVVDTTAPLLSCSANKTIVFGSDWVFDTPFATDLNGVTVAVLSTVTNATCGNGFTATRTWQALDACSNAALCSQTVSVVDQGPPTILAQPQDQVGPVGATASFGVSVSGCPPVGYQWYFNATNSLAGQTDASLVLTNLTLDQAGSYLVIVTNNYGSVTSTPALLDVGYAPVITSDPTNQSASVGDTVTFIAVAQGTEPLSYQWYFNGTNLINGGTDPTLQLVNLTPAQAGSYAVVVTNRFGSVTSAQAFLTLGGLPLIVVNPTDQVATNGGSALFTVTAQGPAPMSYQWFFNATNLISGATTTNLTLHNVTPANSGAYRVLVSTAAGSVASQDASLRVLVAPRILSITNSGGVITLTFSTLSNLYYEVYYKNSLYDTNWLGLPKTAGQPAPIKRLGTGSPMTVQDVIGSQQRFYTVIAE